MARQPTCNMFEVALICPALRQLSRPSSGECVAPDNATLRVPGMLQKHHHTANFQKTLPKKGKEK
eukprot:1154557-Pelagomonas_calceolata.AAC.2